MYKKIILLAGILITGVKANCQDALFTQFNYAPVNFNPALAGTGKQNLRISGLSKLQWFNLYKPYKYLAGAIDMPFYDNNLRDVANVGFAIDHTGKGYINNTYISGIVGRSFGTDDQYCADWFLSLALQAGMMLSSVNPKNFTFIDQLDQNGLTGDASQVDLFTNYSNKNYFDMQAGGIFTKGNFMVGLAVHHLNEPNTSFNGQQPDAKLPRRVTAHVSYLSGTDDIHLKTTVIVQAQGKSKALIAGASLDFINFPIAIGCWYRNNTSFSYNNAFSVSFTWKWGDRAASTGVTDYANKMGLSYDAEANKPGLNTTHGSMELGLQREIVIDNLVCPSPTSGRCYYRFPWEFFNRLTD